VKLLAVLKDSFREAIDAKVFYVMIGLSALLIVLVGSVSFQPGPADKMMRSLVDSLNTDARRSAQMLFQGGPAPPPDKTIVMFQMKSVEAQDGGAGTPNSTYRIRLQARYPNDAELEKIRNDPSPLLEKVRNEFGGFDDLRLFDVSDVQVLPDEPSATGIRVPTMLVEFLAQPTTPARRFWPHGVTLFFGAWAWNWVAELPSPYNSVGRHIFFIEDKLVNGFGAWIAILLSIVISALFIPNMLRKGTVDLLLVKPMSRVVLLIYKYLGGLIFILLNTAFVVVGVWTVLGLRSGVWAPAFLLSIPIITFFFAILYSVSTLFGVLSRNAIVSILMTCLVWFILWGIGHAYLAVDDLRVRQEAGTLPPPFQFADNAKVADTWWYKTIKVIHFVVPRTTDLDHLMERYLFTDLLTANQIKQQNLDNIAINWGESITVSLAFIAVMLGLSCWRFATRDY
jgi:ABC-type transport system involved in multi-copper enzyme maturation permease subunit